MPVHVHAPRSAGRIVRILAVLIGVSLAAQAFAQGTPARPVRLILGFPPGGPSDVLARILAPRLGDALNQTVVVDNRPGASGNIGAEAVARAAPDGTTLLFGDLTLVVNPALLKGKPVNPATELAPIGYTGATPQVLVVPTSLAPQTAAEFVAWAKAQKAPIAYASPGIGSPPHLAAELLRLAHGLELSAVHYKGAGPAIPDLIAGRTQMMVLSASVSKTLAESGKVRALAISGTKRAPGLPNVPTFAESGVPLGDLDHGAWWGIYAPAGASSELVTRLNEALNRVLAMGDVKERLAQMQIEAPPMSPEAFAKFVQDETAKWARVIERARIVGE